MSQAQFITRDEADVQKIRPLMDLHPDLSIYKFRIVVDIDYRGYSWWCEVSHEQMLASGKGKSQRTKLSRVRLTEDQVTHLSGGMLRIP